MNLVIAQLDKDQLKAAQPSERALFFSIAHLHNELNFLHRVLIWSAETKSDVDAEKKASVAQSLFFAKLMAGKLNEGWQLLQRHFFSAQLSKAFEEIGPSHAVEALQRIKRYFRSTNILHAVRNDFAFHYSPEAVSAALDAAPDPLELFMDDRSNANTLFYFAEVLANRAILEKTGIADVRQAIDAFYRAVTTVGGDLIVFCGGYMWHFIDRHSPGVWSGEADVKVIDGLPSLRGFSLPFLVEPD